MVTTIQLHENVKASLERMKNKNETYEQVILRMINKMIKDDKEKQRLMKEECIEMAKDSLKILKEWKAIDSESDWEWD